MSITAISADGVSHAFPDGTDTAVIGRVMQSYAASQASPTAAPDASGPADTSFSGDLKGGLHDLGTAASEGANALGGVMARNNVPGASMVRGAGSAIQGITPDAPAGPSPGARLVAALRQGNYSQVPGDLLHSAVRAAPSMAPIALGGMVGGPAGAGLAAGAEGFGPNAYARAANNNRAEPTTGDVVGSLPATAAQGVAGAVMPAGRGVLGKIAAPAAAMAGMDVANQLGTSVGTAKGASYDPYQTAGAALTGGAVGGAAELPGLALGAGKAGTDNVMSRLGTQPVSVADARAQAQIGALYDRFSQNAANTKGDTSPPAVMNTVKAEINQRALAYAAMLNASGDMDDALFKTTRTVLNRQALPQNNTITESGGVGPQTLFDDLQNSNIDPAKLQPLLDAVRASNAAAPGSFLKNQTGPFRMLGNVAGQVGAVGGAAMTGNLPGVIAATLGHSMTGRVGGSLGGIVDNILGTATPQPLLQRLAANRYLAKYNGGKSVPDVLQSLQDATSAAKGGTYDPTTGNPPDPVPTNTPLPTGRMAPPAMAPLHVNTLADVHNALAQDDAGAAPPPSAAPLPAVAQAATARANRGHAIEFSRQALFNAQTHQATGRTLMSIFPQHSAAIGDIAAAKTPAAKMAIYEQHPELQGIVPLSFLDHGYRGSTPLPQ